MDGHPFYFAGWNNYYLPQYSADPNGMYERADDVDVAFRCPLHTVLWPWGHECCSAVLWYLHTQPHHGALPNQYMHGILSLAECCYKGLVIQVHILHVPPCLWGQKADNAHVCGCSPRDAQSLGLTVLRTWAFNDGNQWNSMQPSMGVMDERVLREVKPARTLQGLSCGAPVRHPRSQGRQLWWMTPADMLLVLPWFTN